MIHDELEYLKARSLAKQIEEARERILRQHVGSVSNFFLVECELDECERDLSDLTAQCEAYDGRVHGDRLGDWFPLYAGGRFWPEDPRPEDINIRDIAHALAAINRFNGMTYEPYSVAQHCVLGSLHIRPRFALAFLLHDAAEAYLGDVVSPVKRLIKDLYAPIEERVMRAVATRFGFDMSREAQWAVKGMDLTMLATEVRDLTPSKATNRRICPEVAVPLEGAIWECWPALEAEERFLSRFEELYGSAA